jgi:hypothetical protein
MQSMSVQQLLQSPIAGTAKGEVATENVEGMLLSGKSANAKHIAGKSLGKAEGKLGEQVGEAGEIDFSSLFAEAKNGTQVNQAISTNPGKPGAMQIVSGKSGNSEKAEKTVSDKVAKTSANLDQLLNNLKGTESHDIEQGEVEPGAEQNLRKGFFPGKKTETENPLEFLVKNTKEKTVTQTDENVDPKSVQQKISQTKSEFFPNKITNPAMAEKVQTKEQTVKVLSGEDFVKNLNAANPQVKDVAGKMEKSVKLDNSELLAKIEKKQNTNIPQIKNYGKGQNILNDSMIRNTNDLAFKDTKKLKANGEEVRNPDMKVANDLSMIKESPLAALQLKNSPVQENKAQVETKVLNLSNIDAKNTNEIIKTISDYVEQNQVGNRSSLDLTVKHDSLGQFKIQVNKGVNQNQIDMQITTSSSEGHKFFVAHESDLLRNLQQSGINLSDFRIVSSMKDATPFSQSESKQFSSFQHEQNGDSKQFMSFESSDFREGSQKRKSLWDEYQERYGA